MNIGRYPVEVFGHIYDADSEKAIRERNEQYCPYQCRECTKVRKSEPQIKVGICTLGYKGSFLDHFEPVIVCPFRFLDDVVFHSIHDRFFPGWEYTKWVKEVNMGVGGSVDYVAVKTNADASLAFDFFCVEFQANGTTGSPYPYVRDLLQNGSYASAYSFGLNWANEFVKTMMQQVYKKGQVVESWGRKIVFVIQDVAMDYLNHAVDTSDLRDNMDDPVHFMMYKLEHDETSNRFRLVFDSWKSADLNGINKILAGANPDQYLTADDFLEKSIRKGNADGVLCNARRG